MRSYIFTEWERELLRSWLEEGKESQSTRNLLSKIRKRWPDLAEDMTILFEAIRKMQRLQRWRGRLTGHSEFESALLRAGSALTRARKGWNTSID